MSNLTINVIQIGNKKERLSFPIISQQGQPSKYKLEESKYNQIQGLDKFDEISLLKAFDLKGEECIESIIRIRSIPNLISDGEVDIYISENIRIRGTGKTYDYDELSAKQRRYVYTVADLIQVKDSNRKAKDQQQEE